MRRDLSGNAAVRANGHLLRALELFHERIPLGPGRVSMSRAELQRMYAKWTPDQRMFWVEKVGGMEVAGELLDGITT